MNTHGALSKHFQLKLEASVVENVFEHMRVVQRLLYRPATKKKREAEEEEKEKEEQGLNKTKKKIQGSSDAGTSSSLHKKAKTTTLIDDFFAPTAKTKASQT